MPVGILLGTGADVEELQDDAAVIEGEGADDLEGRAALWRGQVNASAS